MRASCERDDWTPHEDGSGSRSWTVNTEEAAA
jgi:hypothetical protein